MRATIIVENDQTQSLTIEQGGDNSTVVEPGQNVSVEILSTHPVTMSVPADVEEPSTPAAPVIADTTEPVAKDQADIQPTVTSTPSASGDTGAKVVGDGAPDELKAVADAAADVNSAVAAINVAQADATEANQKAAAAQAVVDGLADDAPDHEAQAANDALTQATQAASDAAQTHADAGDALGAPIEALVAANEAVQAKADDPDHPITQDHADAAQAILDGAKAAVGDLLTLDEAQAGAGGADVAPADKDGDISPSGDTGTTEDGAGNVSTGPTATDALLAENSAAGQTTTEPRDATEDEIAAAIQSCMEADAPTTGSGMVVLEHLNAALTAKGLKPINAGTRDAVTLAVNADSSKT